MTFKERVVRILEDAAQDADERAVRWENRGVNDMARAKCQSASDIRDVLKLIQALEES